VQISKANFSSDDENQKYPNSGQNDNCISRSSSEDIEIDDQIQNYYTDLEANPKTKLVTSNG
jgi:hypothetical protein